MNDDEQCPVYLEPGLQCQLPIHGDDVEHTYEGPLPAAVGQLVAAYVDELEAEIARLRKFMRVQKIVIGVMIVAVVLNVSAALSSWLF